eukprot:GHUV01033698.1.p1 GENE.GHUV01033698.1~~GHUV01033698.1.p1  ORF type:complete len:100 (-),score=19.19 GHUV01033698.1:739-1038(-)
MHLVKPKAGLMPGEPWKMHSSRYGMSHQHIRVSWFALSVASARTPTLHATSLVCGKHQERHNQQLMHTETACKLSTLLLAFGRGPRRGVVLASNSPETH